MVPGKTRAGIAHVSVRLPKSYASESFRRYPLLLVLGELQTKPWTDSLHAEGVLPEMIVATAPISAEGGAEFAPAALLANLAEAYRILEAPEGRWICGAGHDGISAMRAVLDPPDLFGCGACLSGSFEGAEGAPPLHSPILRDLEERRSLTKGRRLYFDYGTLGLDECYEPYHRDLGAILRGKGWGDGSEFTIQRVQGGSHDIVSWQARLGVALQWLAAR